MFHRKLLWKIFFGAVSNVNFVASLRKQTRINIPCEARCFTISFMSFISLKIFFEQSTISSFVASLSRQIRINIPCDPRCFRINFKTYYLENIFWKELILIKIIRQIYTKHAKLSSIQRINFFLICKCFHLFDLF